MDHRLNTAWKSEGVYSQLHSAFLKLNFLFFCWWSILCNLKDCMLQRQRTPFLSMAQVAPPCEYWLIGKWFFVNEVMEGRATALCFLERIFSVSITGKREEHCGIHRAIDTECKEAWRGSGVRAVIWTICFCGGCRKGRGKWKETGNRNGIVSEDAGTKGKVSRPRPSLLTKFSDGEKWEAVEGEKEIGPVLLLLTWFHGTRGLLLPTIFQLFTPCPSPQIWGGLCFY